VQSAYQGLLSELLPQAVAGRMQENHENGHDDSDNVEQANLTQSKGLH